LSTVPEPARPVLTTIEASVAHLVLNRPQARNAITVALAAGLAGALREAAARARVIVIRGAGGHFCAGGDFGEVSRLRAGGPAALRPLFETFGAACELIGELPVPVIAAQAQQWGLVYRAVPAAEFEPAVAALAANLAGKDPVALARAKRLVRDGLRLPLRDGLALETEAIIEHLGGAGAAAGISRVAGRDREESP
jgi:enoyl-CoA hydratase/carnithine racemase